MDDPMLKFCKSATRGPLEHVAPDREVGLELTAHRAKVIRLGQPKSSPEHRKVNSVE